MQDQKVSMLTLQKGRNADYMVKLNFYMFVGIYWVFVYLNYLFWLFIDFRGGG